MAIQEHQLIKTLPPIYKILKCKTKRAISDQYDSNDKRMQYTYKWTKIFTK